MFLIALLILLGVFFLVAELIFLPGVTLGAILALASYGAAAYFGFTRLGFVGGVITIIIILAVSLAAVVLSLRAKTWRRMTLKDKIDSVSMDTPANELKVGDKGTAISRLSPMGKVNINGKVYEAKSVDAYIDQRCEVEVVGFENFNVIVKRAE
ncbi:MAG: NfeD family protein [Alistipes sp.]|nr:NfeD family protein [Alistipes sp.]